MVEENVVVGLDTYRIRLACPKIAQRILPGQFVMLRLPDSVDPLLGRPLAMHNVVRNANDAPHAIDIVYLTVGRMTHRLAKMRAWDRLEIWGPLGNGFPPTPTEHLVMVAGGIGQTPFLSLTRESLGLATFGDPPRQVPRASRATLLYGARDEAYFAGIDDFRRLDVDVRLSTDNGSAGHHGLVTEQIAPLVEASPEPCRLVACGPQPMLAATVAHARRLGIACQVSLETPMACGMGICFSCVTEVRPPQGDWDYARVCVDGPVFDAEQLRWE